MISFFMFKINSSLKIFMLWKLLNLNVHKFLLSILNTVNKSS